MIQDSISVSVIFALPDEQRKFKLQLASPVTVKEVIEASGILGWYPEIDLATHKVGIYGKIVKLDQSVNNGDRIEIYRLVTADPKTARRERVVAEEVRASSVSPKEKEC